MQQKENFPKEWSLDGKKCLGKHSNKSQKMMKMSSRETERSGGLLDQTTGSQTVFLRGVSGKVDRSS